MPPQPLLVVCRISQGGTDNRHHHHYLCTLLAVKCLETDTLSRARNTGKHPCPKESSKMCERPQCLQRQSPISLKDTSGRCTILVYSSKPAQTNYRWVETKRLLLLLLDAASEGKRNLVALVVLSAVESDLHCCGSIQVTSTKQLHSGRRAGQRTLSRQSASYGHT